MSAIKKYGIFLAIIVTATIALAFMKSRPEQQWDGRFVYTCIEFKQAQDLNNFRADVAQMKSPIIPAGSTLSNKSAGECSGVHIGIES